MAKKVTLDPSVGIDPIPTGTGGIVRGATITVKGTAKCIKETFDTEHPDKDPTTEDSPESITEVAVRLGASGAFVKANPTGPVSATTHKPTWSTWTTGPRTFPHDATNQLAITARVSAGAGAQATQAQGSVTVSVDGTPPHLDLTKDDITEPVVNGKATFTLAGTARDDLSPAFLQGHCGDVSRQHGKVDRRRRRGIIGKPADHLQAARRLRIEHRRRACRIQRGRYGIGNRNRQRQYPWFAPPKIANQENASAAERDGKVRSGEYRAIDGRQVEGRPQRRGPGQPVDRPYGMGARIEHKAGHRPLQAEIGAGSGKRRHEETD